MKRMFVGAGALGAAAIIGATGCASGQVAETADEASGVGGAAGQAGSMALRNVSIAYPSGGSYAPGGDAALDFVLVNEGSSTDRLVGVSTPVAKTAAGSAGGAGSTGGVDISVGPNSSVQTAAEGVSSATAAVTLHGLTRRLPVAYPVRVRFTFATAGSVTLTVTVAAPISQVPGPSAIPPSNTQ